jgi:hypothetical protein
MEGTIVVGEKMMEEDEGQRQVAFYPWWLRIIPKR